MIVIDASKSIKSYGWESEVDFAAKLIEEVTRDGNPNQHALNVHYFNTETYPIGQSGGKNAPGVFSTDGPRLARVLRGMRKSYNKVRAGATDHPQVFETTTNAFKRAARDGADKVLVLITDGATHNGKCKGLSDSDIAKKIGKCNSRHACGKPTGKDPACSKQCTCGLYTAQRLKDLGHKLLLVGIANQHHIGQTEAGRFNQIMRAMASSPKEAYLAKDFKDLRKLVKPLVDTLCE